ncbi:hypothetical protein C7293_12770 [filamentous cyanobacterium CCT1]|nr:hypothetical protein C7293_12770 [filamentous cyanobacterium CCT1]PSN80016.1 hypothetical protein C8B47_08690 [filamentous cyanobacterium CCP4]
MSSTFIEGVGGKLAERWVATLLTPAFCFWVGGLLAWGQRFGWSSLNKALGPLSEPWQIAVLIISLLTVAASAFAIQRFDLAILRLLEGYWPHWLLPLRRFRYRRLQHYEKQLSQVKERLQVLMLQQTNHPATLDAMEEQARLDYQRRWLPPQPQYLMPTRLGNSLRAAELRPQSKYGLDAVVCWPHLWLLLPDQARNELQEARANLNTAARIWLWGVLFILWTPLALWALPAGLGVAWFAYRWLLSAARSYGDLLDAVFDLYRNELYKALRWPSPASSDEEKIMGARLSEYLWRGPVRPISYLKP